MTSPRVGDPIRWRVHIPVAPEAVFAALNSDRGRASFWAESAVEADAAIEFRFVDGTIYRSRILERKPPRLFSIDYFGSPARFELEPDVSGGTDVLLTHEGVAAAEWHDVHAGWLNVLFPLKAWVTHGIDLRNHDPTRTWARGYIDQ